MQIMWNSRRRRTIVGAAALGAALLGSLGYLLGRPAAARDLFLSATVMVAVEVVYSINRVAGASFGDRGKSRWMEGNYIAGALLFWGLAIVVMAGGLFELVGKAN